MGNARTAAPPILAAIGRAAPAIVPSEFGVRQIVAGRRAAALSRWSRSEFFVSQIGAYSLILGMIALSLMLLAGYGGMVSLAQITVAGVAGYAVAIFGTNNIGVHGFGWPWWVLVPFAVLLAARRCRR